MRIHEILTEKRRGGDELNPRVPIIQTIQREVDSTNETVAGVTNRFISMTSIEKLGINPSSKYQTPLGIYSYPGDLFLNLDEMAELPFVHDAPFANLFKAKGNIVNLNTMTDREAVRYYQKLGEEWGKISGESWKYSVDKVEDYINSASRNATFGSIVGGQFWYVTREMAYWFAQKMKSSIPVAWNKLFRMIGIDGCIDMGTGIIHTSEPNQAVFFSIKAIELIGRYDNKEYKMEVGQLKGQVNKDLNQKYQAMSYEDQLKEVNKNPLIIKYIKNPSVEMQTSAIMRNPGVLKIMKNVDPHIQATLIDNTPTYISMLQNPTEEAQILAIESDHKLIDVIKKPTMKVQKLAFKLKKEYEEN